MGDISPVVDAVIFDAYGTLLDVHSAMARHASRLGADWARLSAEWRTKQIEYTWVRSLAGPTQHRDFAALTEAALRFVAARSAIDDPTLIADLLAAYRELTTYPEVPDMLADLRERGIARAILSNGTPAMLVDGVRAAGIDGLLDDVLSIERAGVFKPDPRVYQLAVDRFGVPAGRMAFVSSNPWDAFGALSFGFRVIWVNRARQPGEYDLRGHVTEIHDLAGLADRLT
jgi:2-haloacid dehalogenase